MSKRKTESKANEILEQLLAQNQVSRELYDALLAEEQNRVHLQRRRHIKDVLRGIIEHEGDSA